MKHTGPWCNGSINGSNPSGEGSNPSGPAVQGRLPGCSSGLQIRQTRFDSVRPCCLNVPRVGDWPPTCLVSRTDTVRVRGEALGPDGCRSSLTTSTQPSPGTRNAPLARGTAPLVMRRDATLVKWKAQFDTGRGLCDSPRWSIGYDTVLVRLKAGFDSRVRLCWGTGFRDGSRSASGRRVRLSSPPLSVRACSETGSRRYGMAESGVRVPPGPLSDWGRSETGSHRYGMAGVGVQVPPVPLMGSSSSGKTPRSQRGNGGSTPPGSTVWRVAQRQSTSPQECLLGGFPWGTGRSVQLHPCQLPIQNDRRVLS